VLQQIQGFGDPTVSVNDCFRPVSRWWDRITRPEQILESLPQALRVLTDPPMGADVPRPRSEEVRFAHDSRWREMDSNSESLSKIVRSRRSPRAK
jgi:TPP-dependent trihydroxycyclohexane-1,2-dione (THcHDO) dehydratase